MQKNILDWIFENEKIMIIWSWRSWINWYDKKILQLFYNKWLPFSKLKELFSMQIYSEMFYKHDLWKFFEYYKEKKIFCDKNWLDINYFFDLDEFLNSMKKQDILKNPKKWFIYIIKSWEFYKIWKTININKRIKKYITENPNEIEIIHFFETKDYDLKEKQLHDKFKQKNHNREWFKLNNNDVLFLKSL